MSTPSGGRSYAGGQGQGGGGTGGRGGGAGRRSKKKRMPGVNRATGGAGADEQHVRRLSIVSSSILVKTARLCLPKALRFTPPPPSTIYAAVLTLAEAPCALLKMASNAHAPSIPDRHREVTMFFFFSMFLRPDRILFQKVPLHTTLVGSGVGSWEWNLLRSSFTGIYLARCTPSLIPVIKNRRLHRA